MKYEFIKDYQNEHKVTILCDALDIKRSSYYDWALRAESQRDKRDRYLLNRIRTVHSAARENYGAYKTWRALRDAGEQCGLHRVERLRRKYAIEAKRMRLFRASNSGRNSEPAADNVLNRNFKVRLPERCLTTDWILSTYARTKKRAQQRYREFVKKGKNQPSPWDVLKNQIYLGSDEFVKDMQCKLDPEQSLNDIPRIQKQVPKKPLAYFKERFSDRNEAMYRSYICGSYTLSEVGRWFGVSYATVSRAVKLHENI